MFLGKQKKRGSRRSEVRLIGGPLVVLSESTKKAVKVSRWLIRTYYSRRLK